MKVDEDGSDTVRYLTAGVLIRLNRFTQQLEPGVASVPLVHHAAEIQVLVPEDFHRILGRPVMQQLPLRKRFDKRRKIECPTRIARNPLRSATHRSAAAPPPPPGSASARATAIPA
jgi:hypothetical protein